MNRFGNISEYMKTIVMTIFVMVIVLIILLAVVQHKVYQQETLKNTQDEQFEYYLIGVLIDKNKYLEAQYPKNYKINLKLGILYEIYKDYGHSEAEFKLAIAKAPFDDFYPEYRLANLYIKMNLLDRAQEVMDGISERPNKELIKTKGDIYDKLGDSYYAKGDYINSIIKYQKALSYYEIIKSPKIKGLKDSLASAYVYLAERYVDEIKIDEAVSSLEMANSFVDAPIVKYKLALLLIKTNPELAYKYLEEVYKEEPSIMNFDIYYKFLLELGDTAEEDGDIGQAELYRYKARKFKEYFDTNILSVNDIDVEYANGEMSYNFWKNRYKINLELQLKNISQDDLKSLYLNVVFRDENGIIDNYFEKVVDASAPLKSGVVGPVINIKTFYKLKEKYSPYKNITAEVSVSKLEKSYKISLITVRIKEVKRIKRHKSSWVTDLQNWFDQFKLKHFPHE